VSGAFVRGPVEVTVPATSANLGPGYDALGLALDHRDRLVAEVSGGERDGLVVDVEGEGAPDVPRDETHLVVRALHVAVETLLGPGVRPSGLRLTCHNRVPHARGLGSSSAAIVGGLALGRALVPGGAERLDDRALFALAADLEGHPDNVAPAVFGGFTVSGRSEPAAGAAAPAREGGWWSVRLDVDPRVDAVALVPPEAVSTEVARGLLPPEVPHADAADNAGAAALLVAALTVSPDLLLPATRDRLHQDYREPAMPASLALVRALRAEGLAAVVSGAGPTVLVLTATPGAAREVAARAPDGWRVLALDVDPRGVVVV